MQTSAAQPTPYAMGRRTLLAGGTALLAGGAALLLGGCGLSALPGRGGPKEVKPEPTAPPATVTLKKLWDTSGVGKVDTADLAGDVVILAGALKGGQNIPFVADIAGYSVADRTSVWTSQTVEKQLAKTDPALSLFNPPVVCGTGSAAIGVAATYQNPCPGGKGTCDTRQTTRTSGKGLAAIRASDGRLLWHSLMLPAVSRSDSGAAQREDEYLKVIAGDGKRVLYIGGANDVVNGNVQPDSEQRLWTGLLDLATGKELWRSTDTIGVILAGDVVLVESADRAKGGSTRPEYGPLAALDAGTGRQLWSTRGTSSQHGQWTFGVAGLAGITTQDSGGTSQALLLVDPRTGKTLYTEKNLLSGASGAIRADGKPVAVWVGESDGDASNSMNLLHIWTGSGPLRTGTQAISDEQSPSSTILVGDVVWSSYGYSENLDAAVALDLWGRQLCVPVAGVTALPLIARSNFEVAYATRRRIGSRVQTLSLRSRRSHQSGCRRVQLSWLRSRSEPRRCPFCNRRTSCGRARRRSILSLRTTVRFADSSFSSRMLSSRWCSAFRCCSPSNSATSPDSGSNRSPMPRNCSYSSKIGTLISGDGKPASSTQHNRSRVSHGLITSRLANPTALIACSTPVQCGRSQT